MIDADGSPDTVRLIGLELTGGHLAPPAGTAYGGGVFSASALVLQHVLVTGNTAVGPTGASGGNAGGEADGGGIFISPVEVGASSIADSVISSNKALGGAGGSSVATAGGDGGAAIGGGIEDAGGGSLLLQQDTVAANTAAGGAGGSSPNGAGHGGGAQGGGILAGSPVDVFQSTLAANTAMVGSGVAGSDAGGGGLNIEETVGVVVDSTIAGNVAQGSTHVVFPDGLGYGGGIQASGSTGALTLAGDTIEANHASDAAGNLFTSVSLPGTIAGTIVAAGSAASFSNCEINFAPPPTDAGHNLEDDAGAQCRFSAPQHDLVGVNPRLASSLAANGGLTDTIAPLPGSPALGAGGACTNPLSVPPGRPLTVDQRGLPRPTPCDIGAFEHQPPRVTARPRLAGVPVVGQRLSCSRGTWTGDSLSFAYRWLRDGKRIANARSFRYRARLADDGHRLACSVTALHFRSATAVSATVRIGPGAALRRVRVVKHSVAVTLRCAGTRRQHCAGRLLLLDGTVTVGSRSWRIAAGHVATFLVKLNATGRSLLKRRGRLSVTVVVFQLAGGAERLIARHGTTIT